MRREVRQELVEIAAPVRDDATGLALGHGYGAEWSRTKVGQNVRSVYVVPVKKGSKIRSRKRKNFSGLMLRTAMRPALVRHAPETQRRVDRVVKRVVGAFNRK